MYYKNIFDDIVTSDFGHVSSLFDREPETVLTLAKDYLYSQGYFNTLACLHEGFKTDLDSLADKFGSTTVPAKLKESLQSILK